MGKAEIHWLTSSVWCIKTKKRKEELFILPSNVSKQRIKAKRIIKHSPSDESLRVDEDTLVKCSRMKRNEEDLKVLNVDKPSRRDSKGLEWRCNL